MDDGATTVAIKRQDPFSNKGANEFVNEIKILSMLRHRHLVSLVGYCYEEEEMIIVYNYMRNGSLSDHLHHSFNTPLTWMQRLEICLDAAKGLHYLHTGAEHVIIHRDVKTSNILLDEQWVAKVSDFGISRGIFDSYRDRSHVTTDVKGTFGYLDPECFMGRLTVKSDVFAFGVVLFEVLCARPPIIPSSSIEHMNLGKWGTYYFRKGKLDKIIDYNLKGQIAPECLNTFVEMAVACVSDRGIDRPTMRDVIGILESAMQLQQAADTNKAQVPANRSLDLCRNFSVDEIRKATDNFDDNCIISREGFGNVYGGLIDDDATAVTIKRLDPSSNQGAKEFLNEIEILSKLKHRHLVSLIGYCNENGERILVYNYMVHGTLRDHLYNPTNRPLTWKQRLQIFLDTAEGLDYLHTGTEHVIIHRSVKSTSILLDEQWVAKMYDFSLWIATYNAYWDHSPVSTAVKGTIGYLDPEYYVGMHLTVKSDVYAFGVVLFEVLCARPPIIPSLPRKQVNLTEWGISCFRKGSLEKIVDSNLKGQIAPECLNKFVETAVACLSNRGIDRPTMRDVVQSLGLAMQLQEAAGIDQEPPRPSMTATTSHVDMKESHFEHGRTQKAKLLPLSSTKKSDDKFSFVSS